MDKRLLKKFEQGKCSPEEIRKILMWYQSEDMDATFAAKIENLWNGEKELAFPETQKVYQRIAEKLRDASFPQKKKEQYNLRPPAIRKEKPVFARKMRWITIFVLLLTASFSAYYFQTETVANVQPESTPKMLTKEIGMGQKYTIKLPDGTMVKLNSGSTIQYPENFSDSLRKVEFTGEAFFEVEKDPTRPFIIQTGNISTTVLGTSFNIKTAAEKETFEVAVVTGSVKVSHFLEDQSIDERYLTPSQSAVFDQEKKIFNILPFDPEKTLAWTKGIIRFENSSLEDIIQKLERWYGVDIDTQQLRRKITKGYTGSYKDKSLETVLDGVSFVLGFSYEINGKKVIIK